MRKGKAFKVAQSRGVTVPDLIIELYREHQGQTAVAAEIGISQGRVSQLLKEHNLQEKTIVVPRN